MTTWISVAAGVGALVLLSAPIALAAGHGVMFATSIVNSSAVAHVSEPAILLALGTVLLAAGRRLKRRDG